MVHRDDSAGSDEAGDWRAGQAQRLAAHLSVAARSGLYRGRGFETLAAQVTGGNFESLLLQLPLTSKDDLARAGPEAVAVAPQQVAEWVRTSGTLGRSLDVPLTAGDLERLARNEAAALALSGIRRGDCVILGVGMDRMFVAGLAYWLGAQRIGASCVRVGPLVGGQMAMLQDVVGRLPLDAAQRIFVIAVPAFLASSTETVPTLNRKLAGIIAIGESVRNADLSRNAMGATLHERYGCPVMSTYACTETCTTFAEGPRCAGGHLNLELALVEIVDDAGAPVETGLLGEVVVTPLGVEGLPLVRFRTGDMAALLVDPCPCGRTTPRLGPIIGRRQQLLKLRGTSVYPGAIIEALRTMRAVRDCLVVGERDDFGSDRVMVYVDADPSAAPVTEQIEVRLAAVLRVTPEVRIVDATTLLGMQKDGRKIRRFIDRRIEPQS